MHQTPTQRTAAAVRAELARHNLKARDICRATGMKPSTVSRRLQGTHAFRVDELAAIAAHLGVPVTTFLNDQSPAA